MTRSDAVWISLADVDFISRQLKDEAVMNTDMFSLVEIHTDSRIIIHHQPIDWLLFNKVISMDMHATPADHGDYIPSLEKADEQLLLRNTHGSCALMLLFLSGGRPSDHVFVDHLLQTNEEYNLVHINERVASRFGRRLTVGTIGIGARNFGSDTFHVLKSMTEQSEQFGSVGTFQAPAVLLSRHLLGQTFTSLASELASTKTELTIVHNSGECQQRTVRDMRREPRNLETFGSDAAYNHAWHICSAPPPIRWSWSTELRGWTEIELMTVSPSGVAMRKCIFGEGAERMVRQFREVGPDGCTFVGPHMVAKESRFVEDLKYHDNRDFHMIFCQTQCRAQQLAAKFNQRLSQLSGGAAIPRIHFIGCSVYEVCDDAYRLDWSPG
eukprot:gene1920-2602_t